MRTLSWSCLVLALKAGSVVAAPAVQVPLHDLLDTDGDGHSSQLPLQNAATKKRPLTGKFLHFTDFHPDRFYQVYSSTSEDAACHRGTGPAGIYGAETSECDSPIALVNKTMEWIAANLRDEVDFVIWTGDSARHDNDDEYPRSTKQVAELNQFMIQKVVEVWGKKNGDEDDDDPNNDFLIPIVPNIGNNDVLPHNIMSTGPNEWTRRYASMWRQFIPEAQRHSFEQGGWFNVEVIPRRLAVFSLNTMYFFHSNAAVDGCAAHSEPGYRQMEWLRIQLQFMRDRGMKAILIGHVPPARTEAKQQWDETCWQKYALWLQQYRDVIVTSAYGHMNYDHFFLQDFHDIRKDVANGRMPFNLDGLSLTLEENDGDGGEIHAELSSDYFVDLRHQWSKLPKPPKDSEQSILQSLWETGRSGMADLKKSKKKNKDKQKQYLEKIGGPFAENFAAAFVSASVVPNLFPTLRVFEYNITGLEDASDPEKDSEVVPSGHSLVGFYEPSSLSASPTEVEVDKKKKKKKKKDKKIKFTVPDGPSKSAPPGPAYSPQTLSLVGFTQYFANLTRINNDFADPASAATAAHNLSLLEENNVDDRKWKPGKHHGKKPHDKDHKPNPKKFYYEVIYDTKDDDVYGMEDLTMPNIIDLARRIGEFKAASTSDFETADSDEKDKDSEDEKEAMKKKHKKKKHSHNKRNQAWYTFIRRAFVYTIDPEDIDDQFGD